jgi:Golgi SNAP receptor complex protein 1
MAGYDALNRQCRTLESLFDAKLTAYARMGSQISRTEDLEAGGSTERWSDVEDEVEDLLEKV